MKVRIHMQNPFNQFNQNSWQNIPVPPQYAVVKNDANEIRIAKVGLSWTSLIFGCFPALFRGDWYHFLFFLFLQADYELVALIFHFPTWAIIPFASLVFTFGYNYLYFRRLFSQGFVPADERSKQLLTKARYWRH